MIEDVYGGIIIYLIGYTGVGKRTIAKEISKITAVRFFDNDHLYNVVTTLVNQERLLNKRLIKHYLKLKLLAYDIIIDGCNMHDSFILCEELHENNPLHKELYDKMFETANSRGSIFIPIILDCAAEEIIIRYMKRNRTKEFKPATKEFCKHNILANKILNISHPNELKIDVTSMSPKDAANEIVRRMEKFIK